MLVISLYPIFKHSNILHIVSKTASMSRLEQDLISTISDAFREINEILGYEYFESPKIHNLSIKFAKMLPFVEPLLKSKMGVTLQELEKEDHDYDKAKAAIILGIFHGIIIKDYKGNSFEEKFKNYLYCSGTEKCEWIGKTDYPFYFHTLMNHVSKLIEDTDAIKFVNDYLKTNVKLRSQAVATILTKRRFFKDSSHLNEIAIDEHIDIFKSLSAIAEDYFKLIYAIINNYWTVKNIAKLEKTEFYEVWKGIRKSPDYNLYTKSVPNTIYWNAAKHNKCFKNVSTKQIIFRSNDGNADLTYSDFISLVRDLYACTLTLTKISLMIRFHLKIF
jgi:hypothetical protein